MRAADVYVIALLLVALTGVLGLVYGMGGMGPRLRDPRIALSDTAWNELVALRGVH